MHKHLFRMTVMSSYLISTEDTTHIGIRAIILKIIIEIYNHFLASIFLRSPFMTLTKTALIRQIYKTFPSFSKDDAATAVEAFFNIARNSLINGEGLLITGFGKFNVRNKKKRKGRNPMTGEELFIEARRVITFHHSKILRKRIGDIEVSGTKKSKPLLNLWKRL